MDQSSVVVLDREDEILAYTYSQKDGSYVLKLEEPSLFNSWVSFEVNSLGYEKETDSLYVEDTAIIYNVSFQLTKRIEQLKEVVLENEKKFSTNGNITTIQVERFNSGNEQTLEDILKSLPGIEVLKDGSVKAHGRFISKMLIEGEDMFDSNYKMLTKNLDSKVLKAVDIIDQFEDNPVLAQLKESEKVAIDLKLKKEYNNIWFGNITAGVGTEDRFKGAGNLGLVRKKIKFFNFANYTNTGERASAQLEGKSTSINVSSFDTDERIEPIMNPFYSIATKENSFFNDGQGIFNDALSTSFSAVSSLSSKVKIRGTGYFTNDNEYQLFRSETIYNIDEDEIVRRESNESSINESRGNGEVEIKYQNGDKSYLKNTLSYNFQPSDIDNEKEFNGMEISQNLDKADYSFYNHLNYSRFIGSGKAMHSYVYFGQNKIAQDTYINSPVLNSLFGFNNNTSLLQVNDDKLQVLGGRLNYLAETLKTETTITLGFDYSDLKSNNVLYHFEQQSMDPIDSLSTDLRSTQNSFFIAPKITYKILNNLKISGGLRVSRLSIDNRQNYISKWVFNPEFEISYLHSFWGRFKLFYTEDFELPSSKLFYQKYQLYNFQSFSRGVSVLEIPENKSYNFLYRWKNEMKTKLFSMKLKYNKPDFQYSTRSQINKDLSFNTYELVNGGEFIKGNLNFTSYFSKLDFSMHLNVGQNWSNSLIQANESGLMDLNIKSSSYVLGASTYFKGLFNYEVKFNYTRSVSEFKSLRSETNWQNIHLGINYEASKVININLGNDFYFIENADYSFMNLDLQFNPKNSDFSYALLLNNILNEDVFSNVSIDDYSEYRSEVRLLPRYVYASVKYRF